MEKKTLVLSLLCILGIGQQVQASDISEKQPRKPSSLLNFKLFESRNPDEDEGFPKKSNRQEVQNSLKNLIPYACYNSLKGITLTLATSEVEKEASVFKRYLDGILKLLQKEQKMHSITSLIINSNEFDSTKLNFLGEFIENFPKIELLDLSSSNIFNFDKSNEKSIKINNFTETLKKQENIKTLKIRDICKTNLMRPELSFIVKILMKNSGLKNLSLSGTYLPNYGVDMILNACHNFKFLELLDLSDINFDVKDAYGEHTDNTNRFRPVHATKETYENLCKLLETNHSIKVFNLSKNHIGDDGMIKILNALSKNKSLKKIDLWDNKLTSVDSLKKHCKKIFNDNDFDIKLSLDKTIKPIYTGKLNFMNEAPETYKVPNGILDLSELYLGLDSDFIELEPILTFIKENKSLKTINLCGIPCVQDKLGIQSVSQLIKLIFGEERPNVRYSDSLVEMDSMISDSGRCFFYISPNSRDKVPSMTSLDRYFNPNDRLRESIFRELEEKNMLDPESDSFLIEDLSRMSEKVTPGVMTEKSSIIEKELPVQEITKLEKPRKTSLINKLLNIKDK